MHKERLYNIELNGKRIGKTNFEFADISMGVVYGRIDFENVESPYQLIKDHCTKFEISISDDFPEDKLINSMIIPELKIYNNKNSEITALGANISGMDSDGFEIYLHGVDPNLIQSEFPQHNYEK